MTEEELDRNFFEDANGPVLTHWRKKKMIKDKYYVKDEELEPWAWIAWYKYLQHDINEWVLAKTGERIIAYNDCI